MSTELVETPQKKSKLTKHREPEPLNELTLLRDAIAAGAGPEAVEKLVALLEHMEDRRAEKLYNEAMHACQAEMPVVIRDAENSQTKSRYAKFETIQQVARPIYTKHGFSLSFQEEPGAPEGMKRISCDCMHVGGCTRRKYIDLPIDGVGAKGNAIGAMNPVQAHISSTSYGERTLTCMIFNMTVAGRDIDGQMPGSRICEQDLKAIENLLYECKQAGSEVHMPGFYSWLSKMTKQDIRQTKDIPQAAFERARDELKKRWEKAKK